MDLRVYPTLRKLKSQAEKDFFSNEFEMLADYDSFFNPKFSHQIFHKDETVRGYKDLNIDIFLTPATLKPYLNINYSLEAKNHDDIQETLTKHFGEDCMIKSRQEFLNQVKEEIQLFKPLGKKVGQFMRQMAKRDNNIQQLLQKEKRNTTKQQLKQENVQFDIYKIDADNDKFKTMNRRLQAMLIFYIDGASFISLDGNWSYFLVYQGSKKRPLNLGKNRNFSQNSTKNQVKKELTPKGLSATKYTYKLRISQFLVLPSYQRLGIGSVLLEQMYNFYLADKKCTEITVEDPSHDFQQMKDALDIKLIWKNGFFESFRQVFKGKSSLKSSIINKFNFDQLVLDQQEIANIQSLLKLKKQNILRCFELLILAKLDRKDPVVHQKFAQEVKRKFYYQMNKNLLQPYFQLESFYGNIIPTANSIADEHGNVNLKPSQKQCCDGFGKVISDDQFAKFEESLNKNHHHFYDGNTFGVSETRTGTGTLEYQRVYNKYTPTPLPIGLQAGFGNMQGMLNGQGNGQNLVITKFELPENLQKKILKIIGDNNWMGALEHKVQTIVYITTSTTISQQIKNLIIKVGGYPLIFHHIKALSNLAEIHHVFLMGSYDDKKFVPFMDYVKTQFNFDIHYIQEHIEFNTPGGLFLYKDIIMKDNPKNIFVMHCDICCSFPLKEMLFEHTQKKQMLTMMTTLVDNQEAKKYGQIIYDKKTNELLHFHEKSELVLSQMINCGVYLMSRKVFELESYVKLGETYRRILSLSKEDEESDQGLSQFLSEFSNQFKINNCGEQIKIKDIILPLCNTKESQIFILDQQKHFWQQVKSTRQLLLTQEIYLKYYQEVDQNILTHPESMEQSQIEGIVCIHPNADVHPNAKLGPNVTVGAYAKIGDGARIINSIILEDVIIQPHAVIINSIIGWSSVIGSWARIEGLVNQHRTVKQEQEFQDRHYYQSQSFQFNCHEQQRVLKDGVTTIGGGVTVEPELHLRNVVVLPFRTVSESYFHQIIV
ncbi:mannose-1-phosphate guanylyltransferase [Stylonychia lemnae]|uniref:Mannose-1-phosphate guanylyltransferase n=1 Tax=Stylonychia lemnae TaxID=5949 RepID=A0A078B649_STYLE|nr:mannose-1-phosphate guanylyltransferase [Stylonychia lemnae]|eukprot:CDW89701.1 mannose-1-phosphate guanylyltransferase [Stylonychia lemnae]